MELKAKRGTQPRRNEVDRREFLKAASIGAATLWGAKREGTAQEEERKMDNQEQTGALTVRPYQLLCVVCSISSPSWAAKI
jgi:hypothetical protein